MSGQQFILNLGGEGEIPDVINQQPPSALGQNWLSQQGQTLEELANIGLACLICENDALPFPDGTVDIVYTNHVPINVVSTLGLGVQESEIRRILKSGGVWIRDGVGYFTKP